MEKEKVIQKIHKLLKLQFGAEKIGSTNEAFQAAKMVKKLLVEHNLSMSDIGQDSVQEAINISQSSEWSATDRYGNHWIHPIAGFCYISSVSVWPIITTVLPYW